MVALAFGNEQSFSQMIHLLVDFKADANNLVWRRAIIRMCDLNLKKEISHVCERETPCYGSRVS